MADCPTCNRSFTSKSALNVHKYRFHTQRVTVEVNGDSRIVFRNEDELFTCPYCVGAHYQTPDTLKRHVKDSHKESDSNNNRAAQESERSNTTDRSPIVVPHIESNNRHDHDTAVLSAFDALDKTAKEQREKHIIAELGDLHPIAIIDGDGKEYNLLANKKIVDAIIGLNGAPLVFSLPEKSGREGAMEEN